MVDRWSVVPPQPRTSACGRIGMWTRRLLAPLEQHAPGRLLYVLSRSLRMALLTLMVAAVVTLAMMLVG